MWSLRRGGPQRAVPDVIDILTTSVAKLVLDKTGALIVLHGRDPLHRHVDGGWDLDGALSQPLLDSIFDPHSLGHDGAVLVQRGRLARFGCHLPLSKQLSDLGTRHAAALGVTERTDALCIVVSEQRGTITVSRNGELETLPDSRVLQQRLEAFYGE